ncbi:hypothetical protein [Sphingobium nicotianae]|uniref:Uncharacterized protein n=1 Tax=Sphingobium nicotianae TaxID=2782607 RepID=A0A9X1DCX0_9SPHN|nr:hypothetical protein [Sphingobium nicotianae]MBT2187721.1 hypothetical protein [Sphingobium nicotianae]
MSEEDGNPVAVVRATARKGIAKARKTAGGVINATVEKGEAVIDDTREKTYRAAAETNRLFQEHPIAAVAAAAAAGAVIGIFMPRLLIAGRAGKLAGQAIRAAAASEVAQIAISTLGDAQKAALHSGAGKAAAAVGNRLLSRRAKTENNEVSAPETTPEADEKG